MCSAEEPVSLNGSGAQSLTPPYLALNDVMYEANSRAIKPFIYLAHFL